MILTLVILISLFSVIAFRKNNLFDKFDLTPYRVVHNKECYRVISHIFLHADYTHLIVNMIVLWSFGRSVEAIFQNVKTYDYISSAYLHLSILVFLGIVGSTVSTILKHKNDKQYSAVGASGLVSAMVFTHIFFQPMEKIYFYFAIPIPGIVFGVLYLLYSSYMAKRNTDSINHQAHIWGAIIGFIYPIFMNPKLVSHFIESFKF